jgi:hypothetical protein
MSLDAWKAEQEARKPPSWSAAFGQRSEVQNARKQN